VTTETVPERDRFEQLTSPFRRELLAHCGRILGSSQEAEDLVQETYLRAWRSYDNFEGRSSLRNWLYRIATNACLNAIESRGRRPLPAGLGGPDTGPEEPSSFGPADQGLLDSVADVLFGAAPVEPSAVVESRANLRLALTAAWHHLPPRQRVVLILCEVLNWRAGEVAELLGTSSSAVYSMLQRSRAQLSKASPVLDEMSEPHDPCQRGLLDSYVDAFERADLPALMRLLTEDAVCDLRPGSTGVVGREAIARFLASECPAFGTCVLFRTTYEGMPAFATYVRDDAGVPRAFSLEVLTLTPQGIARIVSHQGPELFRALGLPLERGTAAIS
jgi:RNA polymerase sigma-70 factor (ECF subfamily)